MILPAQPKTMVVLGAGAIGVEFASFYRALGVEVTIVEFLPALVPIEPVPRHLTIGCVVRRMGHEVGRGIEL